MNARMPDGIVPPVKSPGTPKWHDVAVLSKREWTPGLISFRVARPADYRFTPGHYARLGLAEPGGEVLWRPFSMVSAESDDFLEFFVVLVPGGAFSRRLASIQAGDHMLIEKRSFGFLTLDQLATGDDLWMFSSGTGLGPFVSILRDPATWQAFHHLVLVHSVRHATELAYREEIESIREGPAAAGSIARLHYVPVVTRDPDATALHARIPQLIVDGRLEQATGVALESSHSRAMVCGNPELARDMRALLKARGFEVSRRGTPGQMAFEKYW
jgi:ferredoxin--NADP+ reductase